MYPGWNFRRTSARRRISRVPRRDATGCSARVFRSGVPRTASVQIHASRDDAGLHRLTQVPAAAADWLRRPTPGVLALVERPERPPAGFPWPDGRR